MRTSSSPQPSYDRCRNASTSYVRGEEVGNGVQQAQHASAGEEDAAENDHRQPDGVGDGCSGFDAAGGAADRKAQHEDHRGAEDGYTEDPAHVAVDVDPEDQKRDDDEDQRLRGREDESSAHLGREEIDGAQRRGLEPAQDTALAQVENVESTVSSPVGMTLRAMIPGIRKWV